MDSYTPIIEDLKKQIGKSDNVNDIVTMLDMLDYIMIEGTSAEVYAQRFTQCKRMGELRREKLEDKLADLWWGYNDIDVFALMEDFNKIIFMV